MKTHRVPNETGRLTALLVTTFILAATVIRSQAGVALKLEYDGITGNAITNLTMDPSFPNGPTTYSVLNSGL